MFLKHWITPVLIAVWTATASAQTSAGAFWRSLILPGWGQHYANGGGGRFIAAEAGLWLGYLGLNRLADVRADRFHTQAAEYAGARSRGKGRQFLDDLGFYDSRLQHNQFALREDGPSAEAYTTFLTGSGVALRRASAIAICVMGVNWLVARRFTRQEWSSQITFCQRFMPRVVWLRTPLQHRP